MLTPIAQQIIDMIGRDALAAVAATEIRAYDDLDTPGVEFDAEIENRQLRVLITEQPTGAYKVYVFDPRTMTTLRDEPDVADTELAETIATLGEQL